MKLHELSPSPHSTHRIKRVARGHGCRVKTAGRGSKGQNSRSGGGVPAGFEGGQTPWYRRLPKFRGFRNHNRTDYAEVNLSVLQALAGTEPITPEALVAAGILKNDRMPVKVLGTGTLSKKVTVRVHAYTASAKAAIEAAGGAAEVM